MNNNIKILLTINLEGGRLIRQSEGEYITFVVYNDKTKKIVKKGKRVHVPVIASDAKQHVKLTEECYKTFISEYCPLKYFQKEWKKMNHTQRLEWNLQRTCEHFKGKSFTYEILS